jgi:HK97 family phage major capsid protein
MSNNAEELRARQLDLIEQSKGIEARARDEDRDLTDEEVESLDSIVAEADRLDARIARMERLEALEKNLTAPKGRQSAPTAGGASAPGNSGRISVGEPNIRKDAKWGFTNLGDFATCVRNATKHGGVVDHRLQNAALSTYGTEGNGSDGGFAVPPEFRANIESLVMGEDGLLGRCDSIPTNSNMVIVPTDEDTAWGSSGGVQVYRRAEAGTMTQSKPALKELTVRVEELYALVPMTDQLLEDSPMLSRWLTRKAGEKINFRINNEIINGTGAGGQMLGILNSPATVSVAKESSQGADTIVAQNILKMYSRMPDWVRRNAVWLINQDIEPQLLNINLTFQTKATGAEIAAGTSGLIPEGGLRYDPTNGTLMGRPIIATEACTTIGDVGDIILAYLPGYFAPYKAGGLKEAISMHLWFDQGVTAYRWTFRIGGQPWLSAPIARKSGNNTLSHFVTLATR